MKWATAIGWLLATTACASAATFSSTATNTAPFAYSVAGARNIEENMTVVDIDLSNGASDLRVIIRCAVFDAGGRTWDGDGKFSFGPNETRRVRVIAGHSGAVGDPIRASCLVTEFRAPNLQPQ